MERFRSFYGVGPKAVSCLVEDLKSGQTVDIKVLRFSGWYHVQQRVFQQRRVGKESFLPLRLEDENDP